MADKVEATTHGAGISSVAVLTFLDPQGREWIAGASITRARPKGAAEGETVSIQLTQDTAANWRLKEFKVVEP
jgi:hypothetical protein